MSIVNLWRDDSNVLIAVDSRGRTPEGVENEFVKLITLPQARTVLAMRGERVLFGGYAVRLLTGSAYVCSYDQVVEHTPRQLRELQHIPTPRDLPDRSLFLELFVAGWSDELGRMSARRYVYKLGDGLQVDEDLSEAAAYITPARDDAMRTKGGGLPFGEQPEGGFEVALLEYMGRQVEQGREDHPDVSFGGRVLLVRLDRHGLSVDEIGEIA